MYVNTYTLQISATKYVFTYPNTDITAYIDITCLEHGSITTKTIMCWYTVHQIRYPGIHVADILVWVCIPIHWCPGQHENISVVWFIMILLKELLCRKEIMISKK